MTTYDAITDGESDVASPVNQELIRSLRDNPLAIAEQTAGAPHILGQWHPYNSSNVDDSNTGVFYDFAVDGSIASRETPDFEDGWEYMIVFENLLGATAANIEMELFEVTGASYLTAFTILNVPAGTPTVDGEVIIEHPRLSRTGHVVDISLCGSSSISNVARAFSRIDTTDDKIGKARIAYSTGNLLGGKLYLYRRQERLPV